MNQALPLASSTWGDEEITAMQTVIESGHFTMGKAVAEFEMQFARKFGSRFAVMVNSGSSANLLAISALCYLQDNPLQPGDEVIVPSVSWSTTYFPVTQNNLKLVFVDVDKETLNIDTTQLHSAVSSKTKALFVPHLLGNPAAMDMLTTFCEQHGLYLVEDTCESMGATYADQYCGTFGICGTFSCFFSHHISTMEGGMIVTDHEELYHILLSMRSHGWTRHLPEQNKVCKKSTNDFYESFRFVLPGYNLRPLELSGAIGVEQLKKLDTMLVQRRQNAEHFQDLFSADERFTIQANSDGHAWFGFSFVVANEHDVDRESIIALFTQQQIDVRPIVAGNFLRNEVIRYLDHRVVGEHVNADAVHDRGFFIGNHHVDIRQQLDHIQSLLNRY